MLSVDRVIVSPSQTGPSLLAIGVAGFDFTITSTIAVEVHPFPSVPVTV